MVDPVVARRVEDPLEGAHRPDHLGVDPELVDQREAGEEEDHDRLKAEERERQGEDEGQREGSGPGLAERRRQVVVARRVVDDVGGPHPPALVSEAVEPVIGEILAEKTEEKDPPRPVEIEESVVIGELVSADDQRPGSDADPEVDDAHRQARRGVAGLVAAPPGEAPGGDLEGDERREGRDREEHHVRQGLTHAAPPPGRACAATLRPSPGPGGGR